MVTLEVQMVSGSHVVDVKGLYGVFSSVPLPPGDLGG